jgi:hypothetical protein
MELAVVRTEKDHMVYVMSPKGEVIGVPLWMTDEDACQKVQKVSSPYCSVESLQRLRTLVDRLKAEISHPSAATDLQQTLEETTRK